MTPLAAMAFFGSLVLWQLGMLPGIALAIAGGALWLALASKVGRKPDPYRGQFGAIHAVCIGFLAVLFVFWLAGSPLKSPRDGLSGIGGNGGGSSSSSFVSGS